MHITMSAEARAVGALVHRCGTCFDAAFFSLSQAISKCNAIPKLCELLQPSYEPEARVAAIA